MTWLAIKARTLIALGPANVFRVVLYRLGLKLGVHPVCRLSARFPDGPFFRPATRTVSARPSDAWRDQARYFGWFFVFWEGFCPDWHVNPILNKRGANSDLPWWKIPDFDDALGDIKTVWEASRLDWVLAMAQRVLAGEAAELDRLNGWLADWTRNNPPYKGPNWKCGQEASIRVMHLAMAAHMLGQVHEPEEALLEVIRIHLERIEPTLRYAIAQDNNHGTSEAAALFIGGNWLTETSNSEKGRKWARLGGKWIEERARRLIEDDGSFSQHSVVYHRLFLDTMCMVEIWRRALKLPPFSVKCHNRFRSAALWLRSFTDPHHGDAPNIGANDGARLLPLTDTDYRDFRPSVQLASVLFAGARAYDPIGDWDLSLKWLNMARPDTLLPEETSRLFDNGGYAVLRQDDVAAWIRFPRFRFRPSHADALHIDLWANGENLLRDSGTYSYNAEEKWIRYFPGTESHNTIQFDERDQMPRLGRFLFGDWLKTAHRTAVSREGKESRFTSSYKDKNGVRHQRSVSLNDRRLKVEDEISGFNRNAVLRWRLRPGIWFVDGMSVMSGEYRLTVTSRVPLTRFELVEGWESRNYLQREILPVLEVEINKPGTVISEFQWRK